MPASVSEPDQTSPSHDRQRTLSRLAVFIGKWINEGQTIPTAEVPALRIVTSDIYEWGAGRSFVVHSAYGRIGDSDGGGTEIIGFDEATGGFRCFFFDSKGGITVETLVERDGVWTWSGERTRCTATFSDDRRVQHAHHEWSDDGEHWHPSMDVTLTKIV